MKGLAPHTLRLFNKVCALNCIKPFCLVGGTALAIQIPSRLSEDLDFMSWKTDPKQKQEVDWVNIEKELSTIGTIDSRDIWDFDHVEFVVSGVKISFYASPKSSPFESPLVEDATQRRRPRQPTAQARPPQQETAMRAVPPNV